MKYLVLRVILFAMIYSIVAVIYVNGQQTGNVGSQTSIAKVDDSEEIYYQFRIGEKIRASVTENCSLSFGVINDFVNERIDFLVQEHLLGPSLKERNVQLGYNAPRKNFRFNSEARSAWDHVEVSAGTRLFVSKCNDGMAHNSYKIIVSRDEYFSSIRDVTAYETRLRVDPNVVLEIPQILERQSNFIFAGYAVQLLRGGLAGNSENAAKVLSHIVGSKNVPLVGIAFGRIALRQLLIREGENALSNETRDYVFEHLIDIGSSKKRGVDQVFILFLELAAKEKLNIKQFNGMKNREMFLRNYETFRKKTGFHQGQVAFERQLKLN